MIFERLHWIAASTLVVASLASAAGPNLAVGIVPPRSVVTFDPANPGVVNRVRIRRLLDGERIVGVDYRPSNRKLYALTNQSRILTLDPATGATRIVSTLTKDGAPYTLPGALFGMDFDPVTNRLRVVSDVGANLRIVVENGAVFEDPPFNPASTKATAVAYTNGIAGATQTTLYAIDVDTDMLYVQQPANVGQLIPVGPLGVDAGSLSGFDIRGKDNAAYAVLRSAVYSINLATGAAKEIGPVSDAGGVLGLSAMSMPAPRVTAFGLAGNQLVSFNPLSPSSTWTLRGGVTGVAEDESLIALDVRPSTGDLVGLGSSGALYVVDSVTGQAGSFIAMTPDPADAVDGNAPFSALEGSHFDADFNPLVDRVRVVSDTGQNLRVHPVSGTTFTDGTLRGHVPTVAAAAYTNAVPGPVASTSLHVIDAASDRLYMVNPPNDGKLIDIGALGVSVGTVGGFDIAGADAALAVLLRTGQKLPNLYAISLSSGLATSAGRFTVAVADLAQPITATAPAVDSLVYGLLSDGTRLVAFKRNAPGAHTEVGLVTGMAEGEVLVGIDFRPASGVLYGLSNQGRAYTINIATAAATLAATLAAEPGDSSSPFLALSGSQFGIDFNPTVNRLRVVTNLGQNLRANVDTGLTTTDEAINRPVPVVAAAAYSNNFSSTNSTTLYVLDSAENRLGIVAPPNNGVVTPVGPLGLDIPAAGVGFEIVGGANGVAVATMDADADGRPELYRINLATGAATLVGDVGSGVQGSVTSVTLQVN